MATQSKLPLILAVGVAIVAITAYMIISIPGGGSDADMSKTAVQDQIKPVGSAAIIAQKPVAVASAKVEPAEPAAPAKAEPAVSAAAVSETTAASSARPGEEIFNSTCTVCHTTGVAEAPKIADNEAWAPRIATGIDAMLATVINGKGAMPPRGTCGNCSDDELKGAIEYMVSKSQ